MKRIITVALVLCLSACSSGGSNSGNAVTDAELQQSCQNGVNLCKDHQLYSQTFGAQDCSTDAIAKAYQSCNTGCRINARPIIDCQKAATTCEAFAACVQ